MKPATRKATVKVLPIFNMYSIQRISRWTGHTEGYVEKMRDGISPITDLFKNRSVKAFRLTEEELFRSTSPQAQRGQGERGEVHG